MASNQNNANATDELQIVIAFRYEFALLARLCGFLNWHRNTTRSGLLSESESHLHIHLELVVRISFVLNLGHFAQRFVHNDSLPWGRLYILRDLSSLDDTLYELQILWWGLRQGRVAEVHHKAAVVDDSSAPGSG